MKTIDLSSGDSIRDRTFNPDLEHKSSSDSVEDVEETIERPQGNINDETEGNISHKKTEEK